MESHQQVALITGASRGLGLEVARLFARRGMPLILTARGEPALSAAADELRELTDVVALSPSMVVAVGRSNGAPLVLRWNGTSWTRETTPASSNPYLTGAAAAGSSTVWAVGYRFELNAYANRTLTLLGT